MKFIGQDHIMKELSILLPPLFLNENEGENFLLRGPSGYGKTKMAIDICTYVAGGTDFQVYGDNWTNFNFTKRVVFIDEVHNVPNVESFYWTMDEHSHVFVFATNSDGNLPEAFVNRCQHLIFSEYSDEDLLLICTMYSRFKTRTESFMKIIQGGERNPRIIKSLCKKFSLYFEQNPEVNPMLADFEWILRDVFSIKDGLNALSRRYLDTLEDIGGTSSVTMLANLLHVDTQTLTKEIEPILLKRRMIRISSKGRSLIKWQ